MTVGKAAKKERKVPFHKIIRECKVFKNTDCKKGTSKRTQCRLYQNAQYFNMNIYYIKVKDYHFASLFIILVVLICA